MTMRCVAPVMLTIVLAASCLAGARAADLHRVAIDRRRADDDASGARRPAADEDRHRPDPRPGARLRQRDPDSARPGAVDGAGDRRQDCADRRRRALRVPRAARRAFLVERIQVGIRERAIRADAPVRAGAADRARRQAGARQGRHLDAARRRHHGTPHRRVRRSRSRRDGQRDAADVVERTPSIAADRAHDSDQRSRPVPDVRTAAGRVLHQRDAAQHRHHDARRRDARRRVGCVRLDAVIRLRADVLSRNDGRGQRPTRHRGHCPGSAEHGLRAGARTPGADQRHGDDLGGQAARRRHGLGDALGPRRRRHGDHECRQRADDEGWQLHAQQRRAG